MVAVLVIVLFAGAMATAVFAVAASVAPQWRRIVRLACGHVEQPFAPLTALARAERRIAVRHWASTPAPASRQRAAA